MSVRLYVGNLPKEEIERQDLQALFADAGESVSTKLIVDRKTKKCRGFAFVTVPTDEIADQFIEKYNGLSFMDSPLKIEKALPRSKGKGPEEGEAQVQQESESKPVAASSRRGGSKRSKRQTSSTTPQPESFQPDPRWAGELAKLKEMLAAQTVNS